MGDADEVAALQQNLEAKRIECGRLQATLAQVAAQKVAAHEAGMSGVQAAKTQMERLRAELLSGRRWTEALEAREGGYASPQAYVGAEAAEAAAAEAPSEEAKMHLRSLQVAARELRHELSRWKNQVDLHEAKIPKQEDEIVTLKAELTHTLDIFTSTQHAVKHHEVELEFLRPADGPSMTGSDKAALKAMNLTVGGNDDPYHVPLHGGGHSNIEALAERQVRETCENRNIKLSGKAKRLTGVVAAQQLLIQRLEKEVLEEERSLQVKDRQLSHNAHSINQLKTMVRQHSDSLSASLLGIALASSPKAAGSFKQPQRSSSAPRLPTI